MEHEQSKQQLIKLFNEMQQIKHDISNLNSKKSDIQTYAVKIAIDNQYYDLFSFNWSRVNMLLNRK